MKSKILVSLLVIVVTISMAIGATMAYFSDTETSTGNTFTAGTLDLQVGGGVDGTNTVKFNVANMRPDSQPTASYTLNNAGSTAGYLNLTNISVVNNENGIIEPEAQAGDTTSDIGELGDVVNLRLYVDTNGDGYFSAGEVLSYNGKVSNLPTELKLNQALAAGASTKINAVVDWWSTADDITDNKAQGDSMIINLTFALTQKAQ